MRFLINAELVFDDEAMNLKPLSDLKPKVKLGSIHSRCFSYLCQKWLETHAIVTKKELFYEGWERHGLVSSNNSLAQTIFQLRRSLRPFNLSGIIATIPRVGFKLQKVRIRPLGPEDPPPFFRSMVASSPMDAPNVNGRLSSNPSSSLPVQVRWALAGLGLISLMLRAGYLLWRARR